jgi:hypothetical protein
MKVIFAVAGVMVLGAGATAQDTGQADRQGNRRYKIVGQVVSSDPGARTMTLRSVSRRQDGTRRYEMVRRDAGSSTNTSGTSDRDRDTSSGSMAAGETITVSATGKAVGELDDYKSGDWVELTCADARTAATARTGSATGTTGATTGSMAGSTTGATGAATADSSSTAGSSATGTADAANAQARFAAWVTNNCGVVMDIDGSRDPMGTGDRR